MPTKIALRLSTPNYDHWLLVLRRRYGAGVEPGACFSRAIKEVVDEHDSDAIENIYQWLESCSTMLIAIKPAPDADDRTRQEWAALRDAVERAQVCAENIREKTK